MSRQRAEELLAYDVTAGLSDEEAHELSMLLGEHRDLADGGFERAAAAIHLALAGPEEPLSDLQRQRLKRAAERFLSEQARPSGADRLPVSGLSRGGWLAAAACLLLALIGWWPRLVPPAAPPQVVELPPPGPEQAADALLLDWQATEDAAASGASGGVVWSTAEQRGFMRISGLAVNDPGVEQYQLWIFDREQEERYPVDGGVFDMPAGAEEAVVPINAKIAVGEPYLFAVTVEKPGGVVVSDRERIVLLAQV